MCLVEYPPKSKPRVVLAPGALYSVCAFNEGLSGLVVLWGFDSLVNVWAWM